jgi:acetoin utilization deacetylase AcuC-like enzyme
VALRERGIPVAVNMAGGYGRDIATTVQAHCQTLALAWQSWQAWQTPANRSGV